MDALFPNADWVTCTTEHLASRIRPLNANLSILQNEPYEAYQQFIPNPEEEPDKHLVKFGWFGGAQHGEDMELLREGMQKLRRAGYRSWDTDTCGLHVHASRTSFVDRSHLWKWTYLINKNNKECIELAGRNSHYAQFYGVKPTSDIVLRKAQPRERYVAINLNPKHTVEVRIFKGSLRIPRVKTALDFMQSTIEFANKLTIKEASGGNTWGMYRDYVGEHAQRFENLHLRLNADKLTDASS